MPYEGLSDEELSPEPERILMPARWEKHATLELLDRFPDVSVYGLLLTEDPDHPMAQLVQKKWSQLHHLTGSQLMLVAFQPPTSWSAQLTEFWRDQLGDEFEASWSEWQQGLDAGLAYDYLDLFQEPRIEASQLPCLVLFTNAQERQAVVRSLPNWDEESLYKLLVGIFETVRQCSAADDSKRLSCLEQSLTSPGTLARDHLGHLTDRAIDYLKEHPAQIATTTLSFVLALASANVLPLSATVVSALTVVKDALSS